MEDAFGSELGPLRYKTLILFFSTAFVGFCRTSEEYGSKKDRD